jgi:hypothetical protein
MDEFDGFMIKPVEGVKGICFEKILEQPNLSAITKETARRLMDTPYLQLGDWFKSLTNGDLTVLNFMVENANEDINALEDLIVLSEMLARAEGADAIRVGDARANVNHFITLITIVSLHRKGLVDAFYENMSFGSDMADKIVAKLKDGINL